MSKSKASRRHDIWRRAHGRFRAIAAQRSVGRGSFVGVLSARRM